MIMNYTYAQNYINWLTNGFSQTAISNSTVRLTTPFLNRNNDHVEVYITNNGNDEYLVSDMGETLDELDMSGININSSERRQRIFQSILNSHELKLGNEKEILAVTNYENMPSHIHMLTQGMIKISDLFYLSQPNVQSLFIDDVQLFLDNHEIRYIPDITLTGKSKFRTNYDFAIPKSKHRPERIIKVVNHLNRTQAQSIMFLWMDTKEERDLRGSASDLYVFTNDTGDNISMKSVDAMNEYGIKTVTWDKADDYIEELAS